MTTFQVILDSIFRVLSGVIPLSYSWVAQIQEQVLKFSSRVELDYLATLITCLAFLIYFRFDWLSLFSAVIRTLVNPRSLQGNQRTLDQEIVLFLGAVSIPSLFFHRWFSNWISESEFLNSPISYGILFLIAMALLRFSVRWNRKIRGLNHLRMIDVIPLVLISILSSHPAFPIALVFWVGFSLTNYHYEAMFKYSMLLLGIQSFAHLFGLMGGTTFSAAIHSIGILNSIAVVVVTFTVLWMTIDSLQKSLSENTFRSFQWLSLIASMSSFALRILKG